MKKMKKAGKSALSALLSASILISSIPVGTITASAEAPIIDESAIAPVIQFTYSTTVSTWDGTSYDFSWYESPATEGVYHITTAAQFAALTILTNDLTKGFATWAESLPDSCDPYLSTVDNFAGKTVYLDCDINFQDRKLLPISYVFDTPNITSTDYDALSHVPAYLTAVDEWVGDGNGNKIITRYLEVPEAEMRYRDLLHGANFDHDMVQFKDIDPYSYVGCKLINSLFSYDTGLLMYDKNNSGTVYNLVENEIILAEASSFKSVQPVDLDTFEIPISYYYQNPYEQADNKGFAGTFDGQGNYIMNFTPWTPWTSDYDEITTTYDPIGRGLFSMLDRTGVIRDLSLQGSKSATYSYSALLCAFNYGTIDSCYVFMNQSYTQNIVRSTTPSSRVYGEYDSEGNIIVPTIYQYSSATPYLPAVSCSGILTAWNCGTISNSRTAGTISYPGRQFGCIACINDGTIHNSINTASSSSYYNSHTLPYFATDEFSWSNRYYGDEIEWGPEVEYKSGDGITIGDVSAFSKIYKTAHDKVLEAGVSSFYDNYPDFSTQADLYDTYEWSTVVYSGNSSWALAPYKYSAAAMQGYTCYDEAWVPYIATQKEGQSLAANHIYGVYGLNCIAGICVVNNGTLSKCTNKGRLYETMDVSLRGESNKLTNTMTSYIRPTNAFALFCTQLDTHSYAAGICVYNYGKVEGCNHINSYASQNTVAQNSFMSTSYHGNTSPLLFAYNGFYANDCLVYDDYSSVEDYVYNTGGYRWWVPHSSLADAVYSDTFTRVGSDFNKYTNGDYTDQEGNTWVNPWEDDEVVAKITYNYLPVIENMPYPKVKLPDNYPTDTQDFDLGVKNTILKNFWVDYTSNNYTRDYQTTVRHGMFSLVAFNFGDITGYTEDSGELTPNIVYGGWWNGVCYLSQGLGDSVATFSDVICTGTGGTLNAGLCTKAIDTNIYNVDMVDYASNLSCIAWRVESLNGKETYIDDITVRNCVGGIGTIVAGEQRMVLSDWVQYSSIKGEVVSGNATNVDFEDIFSFGSGTTVLGNVKDCNAKNVYVYGNITGNGLCNGTIAEYVDNYHYYGYGAAYAVGTLTGGKISNIFVNTIDPNGKMQAVVGVLKVYDAEVSNINIFALATREVLIAKNCNVKDVIAYIDTPYISSAGTNIFAFDFCTVDTALLQSNVDIEWAGFNSAQQLPGLLRAGNDTTSYTNTVVQTPNGAVSYSTYAFALEEDKTIRTDAQLIYDPNARATGALAYWMDHGDKEDRTYNYTVAHNDVYDLVDDYVLEHVDISLTTMNGLETVTLPAYTRKRLSEDEPYFYRISAPYTSMGAGELILEYEDQSTDALDKLFTVTDIYVPAGEDFTLQINEAPGYGILSMSKSSKSLGTTNEPLVKKPNKATYGPVTEDIEFNSTWTEAFGIYTEDNDKVTITPNASGSVPYETVDVSLLVEAADTEIKELYYYNHVKNSDNDWIIDTSRKVPISLSTMSFIMPTNPVTIGCKTVGTSCTVQEFILAGTEGVVNADNRTISVYLENSTDLQSIAPDAFEITGAMSVYPEVTVPQDFSSPVKYTITAENGDATTYTVLTYPKVDGYITCFDLNGYKATIDNEALTIDVFLPIQINLQYANPTIVWSGTSITPAGVVDLSSLTGEYKVTASDGTERVYTVTISYPEEGEEISNVSGMLMDGTEVVFTVDQDAGTISAEVPYGTDVSEVLLTSYTYSGLSSNILEGDTLNLSKSQIVVVQDAMGDTSRYRLYVKEKPDSTKQLHQISLYGYEGVIDEEAHEVIIKVPSKYDIKSLPPDVITFTGKELDGIYKEQDWTSQVTYTITAYDGSQIMYTVRVLQE